MNNEIVLKRSAPSERQKKRWSMLTICYMAITVFSTILKFYVKGELDEKEALLALFRPDTLDLLKFAHGALTVVMWASIVLMLHGIFSMIAKAKSYITVTNERVFGVSTVLTVFTKTYNVKYSGIKRISANIPQRANKDSTFVITVGEEEYIIYTDEARELYELIKAQSEQKTQE